MNTKTRRKSSGLSGLFKKNYNDVHSGKGVRATCGRRLHFKMHRLCGYLGKDNG